MGNRKSVIQVKVRKTITTEVMVDPATVRAGVHVSHLLDVPDDAKVQYYDGEQYDWYELEPTERLRVIWTEEEQSGG